MGEPVCTGGLAVPMNKATSDGGSSSGEARIDALEYLQSIVDTVREPLLVLDSRLRALSANRSFCRTFRVSPQETEGQFLYDLGNRQWDIPRLRTLLEEILPQETALEDFEVEQDFPGIGRKVVLLNARRLRQEGAERILLAIEDVTERRRAEKERQAVETRFTALVKNIKDHSIFSLDPEGRITSWNVAAEHILGYTEAEVLGRHFAFIFTPEDREQGVPEAELRAGREQGHAEGERWYLRKGGERFWALGIVSALHDAEGRLTGFSRILRDMTDWRRSQQALQASEQRLRRMLNVDGVGVLIFDGSGTLVDANDAFLKMSGYGREEIEARVLAWPVMTPPEHRAESERQMGLLAETGRSGPYEKEYFRKDGSRSWMVFAGASLGDGTVVKYCVDVNARRRSEEALRESESRFRTMADGLPLIVWVHDAEGRQEFVNQTFCEFFGVSAEEAAGDSWQMLMHPDDAGAYVREFQECVQTQRPFHAEVRVRASDGQWRWIESWGRPRFSAGGAFLGFVGTSADSTERKRAEDAQRRSEARYRELVHNANSAILRWTPKGTITYFNECAERIFGYSASEVAGRHVSFLVRDQESLRRDLPGLVDAIACHPERQESNVTENLCREGRRLWMAWTNKPMFDAEGRFVEVLSVGTDITRLKAAEAALQEADRRKDEFIATLAHELRNPLAPIRTGLDLIEALSGNPTAREEPLQIMDRQLSHLVRLIDDLLDVSRISRGKVRLRKERVDLEEVIAAAGEMSDSGLRRGDRQFSVSVPSEPLVVEGDRVRLVQILANLLNNAVKFTGADGRIDLRATPHGERVEIQVQDDGLGIPRERLDTIFEMFSQTEPGRGGGLGIGLSLVRGLAELHGGTVCADSEGPGCGATFTVSLPLWRSAPVQSTAEEARTPGALPAHRRVLVVDDNRDITEGLRLLLTMWEAEVRVAHDGAEAIRIFEKWPPTHVLMDIGMPGMNGYEAARRLRANHADHAFRLVALTGWGGDEDRQRAREAGFDEHLVKPVRVARLKAVLSR
ncbi:MAG: PAS domain S-box protein [Thioalkalivibrio sp.]|nr:MAG: PAS domain S-box protein [Thioalkalivibrio sp.]